MEKEKVLAYIVKTDKGVRVKIFYSEKLAADFIFDLLKHGCDLVLHIEELT